MGVLEAQWGHTTASHLAVALLRESCLVDRPLYLSLCVRAGLLSKRTEEGPTVPSTRCAHRYATIREGWGLILSSSPVPQA